MLPSDSKLHWLRATFGKFDRLHTGTLRIGGGEQSNVVRSFNGRTNHVRAEDGDYTAAQIVANDKNSAQKILDEQAKLTQNQTVSVADEFTLASPNGDDELLITNTETNFTTQNDRFKLEMTGNGTLRQDDGSALVFSFGLENIRITGSNEIGGQYIAGTAIAGEDIPLGSAVIQSLTVDEEMILSPVARGFATNSIASTEALQGEEVEIMSVGFTEALCVNAVNVGDYLQVLNADGQLTGTATPTAAGFIAIAMEAGGPGLVKCYVGA